MNYREYEDFTKKFRTLHRDDMYHVIGENDCSGMFSQVITIFLIAFALGFHHNRRESVRGGGAINHVNASNMKSDHQDLIILLMLKRHPDIDKKQLWDMVEEYAEGGISILYESLRLSEWVLDVESLKKYETS